MAGPRLRIGTSGWSYPDWVGPFYPTGRLPRDFLACHSQHFGAVEIDSTLDRIPTAEMVDVWNTTTPETFRFALKVRQAITHEKRLQKCAAELDAFFSVKRRLRLKLGSLVFQFDASFRVDSSPLLADFLAGLPSDLRYTVEVRHRGWLCDTISRLLENRRTALVLADLYYMPRLDWVMTDLAYIRLHGKRSAIPDDFGRVRLDRDPEPPVWAVRVRESLGRGLTVFAFANNCFRGHCPATARALLAKATGVASEL
ncbi:MAG: DUF72 domain-containing protein [Candidatus Methylomirabilales bacterium]